MREGGYDYIVVGAGSAGCVLAGRLSAAHGCGVLLLEAGGWDRDPLIRLPLGWGRIYTERRHDWRFPTEPEPRLDNRAVECARGKIVGGSSSINAMAYVRGHRLDYERWAASGLPGWSYAEVLPHFKRQESWEEGESEYRGAGGPLPVQRSRYRDALVDAAFAAACAAGFPRTADYNGAEQEGFAPIQSTIRRGRRVSAADAFLRPALGRRNLAVEVNAHATRVLLEGSRAVGVEYVVDGEKRVARATQEVILAAGVIKSPQLLQLSGIGKDLKGIGQNLQDHVSPIVFFTRKEPGPMHRAMRYDRLALAVAQGWFLGTGMASDLPCGFTGFVKTDPALPAPDIQLLLNAAPLAAKPYLTGGFADGFGFRVVLLRPQSRGSVSLASDDPLAPPRIAQNFLAHDAEWATLREGLRITRRIAAGMQAFIDREIIPPGAEGDSDAALDAYIRAKALTTHHPLGTCRMGPASDPGAVVDAELRVHGVQALRVVDASVMPDMVGGNINAAVMMIAARGADLIMGAS